MQRRTVLRVLSVGALSSVASVVAAQTAIQPLLNRATPREQYLVGEWQWQRVVRGQLLSVRAVYLPNGAVTVFANRPGQVQASSSTGLWWVDEQPDGGFVITHSVAGQTSQMRAYERPDGSFEVPGAFVARRN